MAQFRITVSHPDAQRLRDVARTHGLTVLDHGRRRNAAGEFVLHALADDTQLGALRAAGLVVAQHEDVHATGRERQREIGQGDRYRKPRG